MTSYKCEYLGSGGTDTYLNNRHVKGCSLMGTPLLGPCPAEIADLQVLIVAMPYYLPPILIES